MMVLSSSHATGVFPNNISRIVPPPIAVTKEIINTPKRSSFLSIAEKAPETAKAKVPRISMILMKLSCIMLS